MLSRVKAPGGARHAAARSAWPSGDPAVRIDRDPSMTATLFSNAARPWFSTVTGGPT